MMRPPPPQVWQRRLCNTLALSQPTIFALSTHWARSAIAVVRISGPQSTYIYNALTQTKSSPKHRIASVRKLYSPRSSQLLDEALTLFFKQPNTYTGLDLLELHLHGGTAIIRSVVDSIRALHDPDKGVLIRQAEPGEFSRQAFANGKYDLTALEGISDMINAETESQRIASLASVSGQTKNVFLKWREDLLTNVANLTTLIDFGEDHDLEETERLFDDVATRIKVISAEVQSHLKKVRASQILLNGISLALVGPPNAGKSSILNTLANKEAAIVSDIAGTTRDVLDVPLEIGGYKVVVGDTAGIRSLSDADQIEREGIRRARSKYELADFVMVVIDPNQGNGTGEMMEIVQTLKNKGKQILVIINKEDLLDNDNKLMITKKVASELRVDEKLVKLVSCRTSTGIDELRAAMIQNFKIITESESADPVIVSSRTQDILENDVLYGFKQFEYWRDQDDVVLATECLRQSVEGIGKITGDAIGVEEILGVVFSKFCIGK
ncbi:uncharacterized protein LODBEIA_P45640 [Lodderomyces beijingensis]|uniref:TrmE-type G domain-containing protein n=1 Tax=Lodderomyces beijingensis TaxID=1775926 RepID=A0ABP0ZT10_9ASCO